MPPPLQPLPKWTSPTARQFKKNLCQATAPLFSHVSPPANAGPLLVQPLHYLPSQANQTMMMTPRLPEPHNQCLLFCSLVKERESEEQSPAVQVGYLEECSPSRGQEENEEQTCVYETMLLCICHTSKCHIVYVTACIYVTFMVCELLILYMSHVYMSHCICHSMHICHIHGM